MQNAQYVFASARSLCQMREVAFIHSVDLRPAEISGPSAPSGVPYVEGMRRASSLLALSALAVALAGCASSVAAEPTSAASDPAPSASPSASNVDAEAAAKADDWLENAVPPPGAVRVTSETDGVDGYGSYTDWVCEPMETRTAFWTIDGADIVETGNWLQANPTGGLMVPAKGSLTEGITSVTIGNVPDLESLEGIAVARTETGVAIRSEIGVFTRGTVCPTLPEGHYYGGPGQG